MVPSPLPRLPPRRGVSEDIRWAPFDVGQGGGRNLYKSVLRVRAAGTRRGATERGTSGVEHPRSGLPADRGSGKPTMRLRPPVDHGFVRVLFYVVPLRSAGMAR